MAKFCVQEDKLTEPNDALRAPVLGRGTVARRAQGDRDAQAGFTGAAMLPMSELDYTGVTEKLARLERFLVRGERVPAVA